MPGSQVKLGPFSGGMHNSSGTGENIKDDEVFELTNLEVDLDGTLVNRPAIRELTLSSLAGSLAGIRVLGKYLPNDGRQFLVIFLPASNTVRLINALTGVAEAVTATVSCTCVIQYFNRLWVIPSNTASGSGGYFDATSSTVTFTTVAAIPKGESVALYKERIFVGCGVSATSNTARVRFSNVGDGSLWTATDFLDISPGDGEKMVDMLAVGSDIIIFKEHSTWRYGYSKLPAQAELTKIDSTIGVPAANCAVAYDNNQIYVLHDNSVYELFNSAYQRVSAPILMDQVIDPNIYANDQYGLSLFRDRLFVRYYSNLYVYSLRVQKWARWETDRKFSKLVSISTASVGLDTCFSHTATSANAGKIYFFRDDRVTAVGTAESFNCRIVTRTFDFDPFSQFKVQFWGGIQISTSGTLTAEVRIPNIETTSTWGFEEANYKWGDPGTWEDNTLLVYREVIQPSAGDYARRFIKAIKGKIRFRQVIYVFETAAVANTVADSCVKIADMVVVLAEKQVVTKETN